MAVDAPGYTGFITTGNSSRMAGDAEATFVLFLMLAMYGGQIAVFAVQDMLLFFLVLIRADPVYLLLAIWGQKAPMRRRSSFFTRLGSLFILVAALTMAFYGDTVTFDMRSLAVKDYASIFNFGLCWLSDRLQSSCPSSHCTLADAHGSDCTRPHVTSWNSPEDGRVCSDSHECSDAPRCPCLFAPVLVILGGYIIYAALTSFAQRNLKRKLPTPLSHMGFVLIGIASLPIWA